MRYLVPHAVIVLAMAAWAGGHLPETPYLIVFVAGHLLVPVWAAAVAPRGARVRAILLGPGIVVAVHALLLAIIWIILIGAPPEGAWISLMMLMLWAGALVAYVVYCVIAFSLIARVRRS